MTSDNFGKKIYKSVKLVNDGVDDNHAIKYKQLKEFIPSQFNYSNSINLLRHDIVYVDLATTESLTFLVKNDHIDEHISYYLYLNTDCIEVDGFQLKTTNIKEDCEILIMLKNQNDLKHNNIYYVNKHFNEDKLILIPYFITDPHVYKDDNFIFCIKKGLVNGTKFFRSLTQNDTIKRNYFTELIFNELNFIDTGDFIYLDEINNIIVSATTQYILNKNNLENTFYRINLVTMWRPNELKLFFNDSSYNVEILSDQVLSTLNLIFTFSDSNKNKIWVDKITLLPGQKALFKRSADTNELILLAFSKNYDFY